jgi:hypothetical protein
MLSRPVQSEGSPQSLRGEAPTALLTNQTVARYHLLLCSMHCLLLRRALSPALSSPPLDDTPSVRPTNCIVSLSCDRLDQLADQAWIR